jgi:phosphopantetheinyl transferase (holo-ACP synthase)
MKILGLGMDIVETKRIADSLARFGDRFFLVPKFTALRRSLGTSRVPREISFRAGLCLPRSRRTLDPPQSS